MNEIRELTSKFCSNVSSDPRLLQETIRQSFKDLCSLSKQMKFLADYGPILMSKKLFEPVSPGASSPCHSDNCLDDDEEKIRVLEPTLYEVAEIFLDTSAIIEISQSAQNSNWCLWIMICGLHDESALKGLLALVEKHVPNVQYETCKKVVYKGQTSFVLHFKEHFTTQKVFTFLKEDFYAKTYIKDRWQIMRFYNRMDDPKYMSQFYGVVLQNLPLDCTSQTIIDLVSMHSSNISVLSVEIPTLIGDSFCSLIRTKTLEDAEMLALTLNGLITQTGNIRAGLHPSCNFKHQNFDKDPFKEIKIDHHHPQKAKVQVETEKEKKNDIKALLSLFKNELKTSRTPVAVEAPKIPEGQKMIPHHQPFAPRQYPPNFFEPRMPGPSFAFNGPPLSFQNNPGNPAMFYGPPKWVPPDYYRPTAEFPHQQNAQIQKFGKKIQKTFLKPTRASSNHQKTPIQKDNFKKKSSSRKGQPLKLSNKPDDKTIIETKKTEISQLVSPAVPAEENKELVPPSLKRNFVESIQGGSKQNLEKVFEKKLADWNIGVYQAKSTLEKKVEKSNSVSVSNWKITCGTSSNGKASNNNKLPFYLENMMDQMVNPSKPTKPSRFSDKREGKDEANSLNQKRKFETLYPDDRREFIDHPNQIQKLKTNIQEFQKKSDEVGKHDRRLQRSKKGQNKQNLISSSSDEEKELDLGPQKKQYLETFTAEIPTYRENFKPKVGEEKGQRTLDSLGWSIKCQPKKNIPEENKNESNHETAEKAKITTTKSSNSNEAAPMVGPTNIVFNGPYVQSSNLNYMYMPPGMAYPHLLMNMNQHQPPMMPNSFSFNPQMMVYHNNFILNPLVPCHNQSPFWNVPISNAPQQESAKNTEQTNPPKKFKDWTPPLLQKK